MTGTVLQQAPWAEAVAPHPWRRQQAEALDAIDAAWAAGDRRAVVVLPPGGGKTFVGLEAARRLGRTTLVLVPNTAIQGQWAASAGEFSPALPASDSRDLVAPVTVLTYQALALFDSDADPGEASGRGKHLHRLHDNGQALVDSLRDAGPIVICCDEVHHLVAVWGELLDEILGLIPDVYVIGLTGTPPDAMTADEAALMDRLFGPVRYAASVPGFVRDGYLAPFREFAYFTEPTEAEVRYIQNEGRRFNTMVTDLLDPSFAPVPFLSWIETRFVDQTGTATKGPVVWTRLERVNPALAQAVLRAHVAGWCRLPAGATVRDEHRVAMSADDWAVLIGDYAHDCLGSDRSAWAKAAYDRVRQALSAVGYRLTKRSVTRTTSPVDRVLARSKAKADAAVAIVASEWSVRGDALRAVVLTDYESASGTLPSRLVGVIDPDEGSARAVVAAFATDPSAAGLGAVMVTGRSVACSRATAARFVAWVRSQDAEVRLDDVDDCGPWSEVVDVTGSWTSREWVRWCTRWVDDGHGHVLIGTKGLLGEGWDAKSVSTLVDMTAATTSVAVTQTRGRSLRVDPRNPGKVAHNYTVVAVAHGLPKGDADYSRFVRKHAGFLAMSEDGAIVDGVAHVDHRLSPHTPPTRSVAAEVTAHGLAAARALDQTRALWRVGTAYQDRRIPQVQVSARRHLGTVISDYRPVVDYRTGVPGTVRVVSGFRERLLSWARGGPSLFTDDQPVFRRVAYAVADGLRSAGLTSAGAEAVSVDSAGRLSMLGVPEDEAALFATSVAEAFSPASGRYTMSRLVLPRADSLDAARVMAWERLRGKPVPATVASHAVPSALESRAALDGFVQAWTTWVSPGAAHPTRGQGLTGRRDPRTAVDAFGVSVSARVVWS